MVANILGDDTAGQICTLPDGLVVQQIVTANPQLMPNQPFLIDVEKELRQLYADDQEDDSPASPKDAGREQGT